MESSLTGLELGLAVAAFLELRLQVGRVAGRVRRLEETLTPPPQKIPKLLNGKWRRWIPVLVWGALVCSFCSSCTLGTTAARSDEVRHDEAATRTKTTTTKTVPGPDGPTVAEVVETVTTTDEISKGETGTHVSSTTTVEFPPIVETGAKIVMGAAKAAEKAAETATPWGAILGGVAAVATAVAGFKTAQARGEKKRADEHKADADAGWSLAVKPSPTLDE